MPLVDEITAEQRKIRRNISGIDRRQYGAYLVLLPPEKLAVIVLHEVLGMALAGGSIGVRFTRAAVSVGQAVRAELNLLRLKKDKTQYKSLVQSLTGRLSSHGTSSVAEKRDVQRSNPGGAAQ
jgi:DNA-directed RNA polymerase